MKVDLENFVKLAGVASSAKELCHMYNYIEPTKNQITIFSVYYWLRKLRKVGLATHFVRGYKFKRNTVDYVKIFSSNANIKRVSKETGRLTNTFVKELKAYQSKRTGKVVCSCCNRIDLTESFELHHIDGNRSNNRASNLTIVCGSCHNSIHYFMKRGATGMASLRLASQLPILYYMGA